MHILARHDGVVIEISAHDGETPRVCAWPDDGRPPSDHTDHKTMTFERGQLVEFDQVLMNMEKIVAGLKPQVE